MWLFFGIPAVLAGLLGLIQALRGRVAKWLSYVSLSCTALTLCAFYQVSAGWVMTEDWPALMDVVPAMARILWAFTAASVAVNGIALFQA